MTEAERHNEGKKRWSLIDYQSLIPLVEALEYGLTKYEVDNWKKGFKKRELLDSLFRHLIAVANGEEFDESGVHHMGHIMSNAMFYIHQYENNKFIDE